jgi:hypothetical protein
MVKKGMDSLRTGLHLWRPRAWKKAIMMGRQERWSSVNTKVVCLTTCA